MKKSSLVSIIVPIYNVEKYLQKCIDSILNQSYTNLEVILVDDGSTDNCSKVVDDYAKKDSRVIAIHQKNGGQSRARNAGLKKAKGDFISFIDGDDEVKKDFISELIKPFDNEFVALSVCGMQYHRIANKTTENVYTGRIRPQRRNETLTSYTTFLLTASGRMYSSVNKLYRAETIKKHHLAFEEDVDFAEDTRFVLNYIKAAGGQISFVLKPLYKYNFGTEGSTIKKTGTDWKNWEKLYAFLKKWDKNIWTDLVLFRWRVSYLRTVARSRG